MTSNDSLDEKAKIRQRPIEALVESLAYELGVTKEHRQRIQMLFAEFAIEIKRAATEGEW